MPVLELIRGGLLQAIDKPGAQPGPKWNKLFPIGRFFRPTFPKDGLLIDATYLATLKTNWEKAGRPRKPVDYFHNGESDGRPIPVEQKIASGWIVDFDVREDGGWALIDWTDRARAFINAGELAFLSPTWARNWMDQKTGESQGPTLFGAGLLNDPYFEELPRVAASSTHPAPGANEGARMDPKELRKMLGLAESATDDEVKARAAALKAVEETTLKASKDAADAKLESERITAAATESAKALAASQAVIKKLSDEKVEHAARTVELEGRVNKLETERKAKAVELLCKELLDSGRITASAQEDVKEYATSMGEEKARSFYMKLPKNGAVDLATHGAAGEPQVDKDIPKDAASAHRALRGHADVLIKAGVPADDAMLKAMELHPMLAVRAQMNTTPVPDAKA